MIINVGGSGTGGRLKETVANSSGTDPEVTNEHFMWMYGKGMNLIAAATSDLIITTNNLQFISTVPSSDVIQCSNSVMSFGSNPDYNCFGGTSSAAA